MNEKPEALRLAERIDLRDYYDFDAALHCPDAAIQLRRQHAEIERLHDELRQSSIDITRAEVERLKAENERLRDGLACDWAELKACRSRLREHLLEIERLQEALRGIEEGCLDCRRSARAALRREEMT